MRANEVEKFVHTETGKEYKKRENRNKKSTVNGGEPSVIRYSQKCGF